MNEELAKLQRAMQYVIDVRFGAAILKLNGQPWLQDLIDGRNVEMAAIKARLGAYYSARVVDPRPRLFVIDDGGA